MELWERTTTCFRVNKRSAIFLALSTFIEMRTMNFKEFKQESLKIALEQFESKEFHPLDFGIQRALFEEQRLRRLIELAEHVDSLTVKRKAAGWRRQLEKTVSVRNRMESQRASA